MNELSQKQIDDIVKYQPFAGQSIEQWFKKWEQEDTTRIFAAVVKGTSEESLSINNIIADVFGTKDKSGVLEASRNSARTISRTITVAVANHAKVETFKANLAELDDDEGMEWSAVFDIRTCPVCAALDGTRWLKKDVGKLKTPPAHPNCRCTLIPFNDLVDVENETHIAKDEDGEYFEQKGDFEDYLRDRDEEFQKEWLGPKRYDLWKEGKITSVDYLVNPDKGYRKTLEDLGVKKETLASPKIETTEEKIERIKSEIGTKYQAFNPQDYNEIDEECGRIADDFIKGKTETEIWTAKKYTLYGDQAVNGFIRDLGSDPSKIKKKSKTTKANQEYIKGVAGIDDIVKYKQDLTDLFDKYKTDRNYITYRGVNDNNMLGGTVPPIGAKREIKGFSSSSISASVGYNFSKTHPPIVYRILIPKGSSVLPLCGKNGDTTLTHLTSEKELLLKNNAKLMCIESKTVDAKEIGLAGKGKIELTTLLLIDGNER